MSDTSLTPTQQSLDSEVQTWAAYSRGLRIVDVESCRDASFLLRSIKGLRAEIATFWGPHIDAAQDTKRKAEAARKALTDERDRMEAPLVQAEGLVKFALLEWDMAQDRLKAEQERQLQAEAREQAEAQTLAAAAAMEAEAVATGDAGLLREAQDILAQPIDTPVITVQKQVPKVQGVTYRDNWKAADDVDVRALAAAVSTGSVSATFLVPNMTAINQFARATKGTVKVPGVRIWNDRLVAAKG